MQSAVFKPNHKAFQAYYEALQAYGAQGVTHESAVRSAFQNLLTETGKVRGWALVPELGMKVGGKTVRPDGTLRDEWFLPRGYWEAKDTSDKLDDEVRAKIAKGYPLGNTIFEDTTRAVLFQKGHEVFRADLSDRQQLADLLNQFYDHSEPDIAGFEQAVGEFQERIPDLAHGLLAKIAGAHRDVPKFQAAFDDFLGLCQTALNPNIRPAAVDEMLIQHLLTERLFRKVFQNPEFTRRNVIAVEIERVIDALASTSFNRDDFLKSLDRFYRAIEAAAHNLDDFAEKQHFLNSVYERFFQGYSVQVADTHGIVYTPQPIVDFMCASVAAVLADEFGLTLGAPGVTILDPCTGTGNFIVNLLRRIPKRDLPRAYRSQLFANEIMLLPYYIAALNIDWALEQFQSHYGDKSITRWDLFYYVYGVLHVPGFRDKFAADLKRELPRVPYYAAFREIGAAGRALAGLHLDYETVEPWPLRWVEAAGKTLSYRVEKMRLSKDKSALVVNDSLTLADIPATVFDYRLGNRSALEWVIDQYQVSEDKRSGLRSDPNRADDPEAIVRLVGQVVRVSLATVQLIYDLEAAASRPSPGPIEDMSGIPEL